MNNENMIARTRPILRAILLAAVTVFSGMECLAQNTATVVSATEIVKRIEASQAVNYENLTVAGDFDLSNLLARTNDAVYPENSKTARVFSAKVTQPITFRNVIFTGKLIFFRKAETENEIKEYRIVFNKAVTFENCTFNKTANFELTNFDGGVSFANSQFKDKPSFIRIGLEKIPNFTKTIFENGSVFKNFQNDTPRNLSAMELERIYRKYVESGN